MKISPVKKCPRDKEVLGRFTAFDIEVHQCAKCHGMWFDEGELDAIKTNMDDDIRWKDFDLRSYAERADFKTTRLPCANCGAALCELRFGSSHIELEFCTKCGGVWADKGKLVSVLKHLRRTVEAESLEKLEKEALHQFLEIFTGHKGPWEEIKDFLAAWRLLTLKFAVDHPDLTARLETARRALPF
jgi:Zn-finger nucleic acid-binding protein